jgi:hypothetical protein
MAFTELTDDLNIIQTLDDRPNDTSGLTAEQLKAKFDEAVNIIQAYINDTLLVELAKTTDGSSGADNLGMTTIAETGAASTIQGIIEALITRLKSTTEGTSGADLIGATAISGVVGTTAQAILEGLKSYIDTYFTTKTDMATNRKLSASGDFTGTLNGMQVVAAEPGLSSIVSAHLADYAKLKKGIINVLDYGAVGDKVADDSDAILAAVAELSDYDTLYFPFGMEFRTTKTIAIPENVNIIMYSPIIFDNALATKALTIGNSLAPNLTVDLYLNVQRTSLTDGWVDENDIGIELLNCDHCNINIKDIRNFTIGVKLVGDGRGFAYNTLRLGYLNNCKYALDLTNRNSGWCCENLFVGGRFCVFDNEKWNGHARYGIRITSEDGTYLLNDQNIFLKPSFELDANHASPGEAVPILIEHGRLNQFHFYRDEGNTIIARTLNASSANLFNGGWSMNALDDQSASGDNIVMNTTSMAKYQKGVKIFDSGNLPRKTSHHDGGSNYHIPGLHWVTRTANAVNRGGIFTISADGQYIQCWNSLPGVFIDTGKVKKFIVRKNALTSGSSYKGRLVVIAFDASGNQITSANAVMGDLNMAFESNALYNGCYMQATENTQDCLFMVSDNVAKVQLIFFASSNVMNINSIIIEALPSYGRAEDNITTVYSGYEDIIPGVNIASAIPTKGTFSKGKIVYNSSPSGGAYEGWVCVTSGTFGTLNDGNTTGSIASGSKELTVNDPTGLIVGQYITITGVSGVKQIDYISGNAVTLTNTANVAATNEAVAFSQPVLKGFGLIQE